MPTIWSPTIAGFCATLYFSAIQWQKRYMSKDQKMLNNEVSPKMNTNNFLAVRGQKLLASICGKYGLVLQIIKFIINLQPATG